MAQLEEEIIEEPQMSDEEQPVDDESSDSSAEKDQFVVDSIVDVKKEGQQLKFRIHWKGFTDEEDTWEEEKDFRERSHPSVNEMLDKFKEESEKMKQLQPKRRGRPPKKKTWEYVLAEPDLTQVVDRELRPDDEFFGERAGEVSGEKKKLYDPSHKTSSTEIFLSKVNSSERVTRQKMKQMTGPTKEEAVPTPKATRARSKPTVTRRRKSNAPLDEGNEMDMTPSSSQTPEPTPVDSHEQSPMDTAADSMDTTAADEPEPKVVEETNESQSADEVETERTAFSSEIDSDLPANHVNSGDVMPEPHDDEEALHKLPYDAPIVGELNFAAEIQRRWVPHAPPVDQQKVINMVKNCDPDALESAIVNDPEGMKELLMYQDLDGSNFLHRVCASTVNCRNNHYPDDMVSLICRQARSRRNLLAAGYGIDGLTPLHLAVNGGMVCRARSLLKYKAPLNAVNTRQQSPLQLAYEKNHAKMTRLLLEAGSNYAILEMEERSKKSNERKRRSFDVLDKHALQMSNLLLLTRNRVYSGLEEVDVVSPVFTMHGSEKSGTFSFRFEPYDIPSADYTYLLFVYICNLKAPIWTARCWDGPKFAAVQMNGQSLEPIQESDTPMIFYCPFTENENSFHIELQDGRCPFVIALQAVLVKTYEPEMLPVEMPDASTALEYAPLVGPV